MKVKIVSGLKFQVVKSAPLFLGQLLQNENKHQIMTK